MSMRERLAMAIVYALVFIVLPAVIFGPAIYAHRQDTAAFSQSVRDPLPPSPAVPAGLALHANTEHTP